MHVRVRLRAENGETTRESVGNVVRIGRNADCEIALDPLTFPMVSGLHARIEPAGSGFVLVHLSHSNKTLVNGTAVDGPAPLRTGDRVRLGVTGPTIEILAIEPTDRCAGGSWFWTDGPGRFSPDGAFCVVPPRPCDF